MDLHHNGDNNNNEDYLYSPSDYYDYYDDKLDDLNHEYHEEFYDEPMFWSNLSFHQLCIQCVLPAVWSTCNLLGTILLLCIFFRLFVTISNKFRVVPETILHILCAVCGILPIMLFHEDDDLLQLLLQIILFPMCCYILSIICLLTLNRYSSVVFSAIILLTLFYREFYSDDSKWQKIKSAHMLMSMKAMAILFDLQSHELDELPPVSQYAGYMMCAGAIYLGPFLTFQEYSNAFSLPVCWNITKVFRVVWKIIVSLFCFVLSICVMDWLFNQILYSDEKSITVTSTFTFLSMYKRALEFRTGHYFVAYASTVFAIICGYHSEYNKEISVTRPLTIEWPQSLLHVVVHWNSPMHYWLKKYIFEEVLRYGKNKKSKNRLVAVVTTYLISSLLHGLERRLSAVLLSLAAYTYVEHQIRTKLASRFSKTFSYYPKNYFSHRSSNKFTISSNKNTWFLRGINIIFTILNIVHLAYLGSIMDMSVDNSVSSNQEAFAPWRDVSYFSHFIILLMYFISIIL